MQDAAFGFAGFIRMYSTVPVFVMKSLQAIWMRHTFGRN